MYVLRSHLDLSNALAVWHSPGRFRICQNVYTTRFHWQVFASQQWVAQSSHQEFNGRVYLNSDLPLNADGKSICLPVVIIACLCSLTTGTITVYWVKKFSGCWSGPPQTDHNCHLFTQSRRHGDICSARDVTNLRFIITGIITGIVSVVHCMCTLPWQTGAPLTAELSWNDRKIRKKKFSGSSNA